MVTLQVTPRASIGVAAPPTRAPEVPLVRAVIVGSVDDGKSTLLGRLLYECDGLADDQIEAVRKKSKDGVIDFSLFGDGLLAEREQGITIDVAWRALRTPRVRLVLADTPGHVQYTRNMATGASAADVAIILVDARAGVLPQTRRHARIAALMGVRRVVVALNKVDLLQDASALPALEAQVHALLDDVKLGVDAGDRSVLPVSAVRGDNVTSPSLDLTLVRRGDGADRAPQTVLSFLEAAPRAAVRDAVSDALRFPVQLVLRPDEAYRGYAGTIAQGALRPGDEVRVLPSGTRATVAGIDTFQGPVARAIAGQAVVVRLTENVDVARGDVLVAAAARAPAVTTAVLADLVWLADDPLGPDAPLLVKAGHRVVRGRVVAVLSRARFTDDAHATATDAKEALAPNDVARVRLELERPLVLERYVDQRDVGSFILIDPRTNNTVAAGMVASAADAVDAAPRGLEKTSTTTATTTAHQPPAVQALDGAAALVRALHDLDAVSLQWLSGYAAGLAAARGEPPEATTATARLPSAAPALTASAAAPGPVTVVFATQTGNGRRVAQDIVARLGVLATPARALSVSGLTPARLLALGDVVFVTSTHGDGDPPDDLVPLWEALASPATPSLAGLRFAVVGLGDSSYRHFCKTAKDLDERLGALGATRTAPLTTCDVDIAKDLAPFLTERAPLVAQAAPRTPGGATTAVAATAPLTVVPTPVAVSATLRVNHRLTARGALKDVRHLELALPAHLRFAPGDALLVHGTSAAATVRDVVVAAHLDPGSAVTVDGAATSLGAALARRELTRLTPALLQAHAERCTRPSDRAHLTTLVNDADAFAAWARGRQVADLLLEHPARTTAQELVAALRPLQPRAYSLANSLLAAPGEAHLTVAVVDDASFPRRRRGALSGLLADSAEGAALSVQVQENARFRLPDDDATDVVFIGPGTGVAPFRAFLQEREARGARGRHWLFFGEATLASHFLYQREWSEARARGALHRIDVAFSRDQPEKVYVQHRLRERAAELWAWLDGGAHVYVCGDATRMAKDVERALVDVKRQHGGARNDDDARAWLSELSRARRYQKDVY